jgi:hypothetical protein
MKMLEDWALLLCSVVSYSAQFSLVILHAEKRVRCTKKERGAVRQGAFLSPG